jgi:transcriptional regulator with XRE-family HTH domain
VKAIRIALGRNQQRLVDYADLDRSKLSGLEHSKQKPAPDTVKKLADTLESQISDFST